MNFRIYRLPRLRLNLPRLMPWLAIFWVFLLLCAVLWSLVLYEEPARPVFSQEGTGLVPGEPEDPLCRLGAEVFRFSIPALNITGKPLFGSIDPGVLLDRLTHMVISIHPIDPRTFLDAEIPFMQVLAVTPDVSENLEERPPVLPKTDIRPQNDAPQDTPREEEPGGLDIPKHLQDKPLVVIYHSHSSESYIPTSGHTHVYDNPEVTVVRVGEELKRHLEEAGIRAIHSTTVHDYPDYSSSYLNSLKTITQILAENPSILVVLDIHRDASKREEVLFQREGESLARVYIVVGSDEEFSHPNWQENYRFAIKLQRQLETDYPGLSRGIYNARWRYNQHVHPHALLIEIGSHESSLNEALRTTKYFAEVLTRVIAEMLAEETG